jgi:hypothetical protein
VGAQGIQNFLHLRGVPDACFDFPVLIHQPDPFAGLLPGEPRR